MYVSTYDSTGIVLFPVTARYSCDSNHASHSEDKNRIMSSHLYTDSQDPKHSDQPNVVIDPQLPRTTSHPQPRDSLDIWFRVAEAEDLSLRMNDSTYSDPKCFTDCAKLLGICTRDLSLLQPRDPGARRQLFHAGEDAFRILQLAIKEQISPPDPDFDLYQIEQDLKGLAETVEKSPRFSETQYQRYTAIHFSTRALRATDVYDNRVFEQGMHLLALTVGKGKSVGIRVEGDFRRVPPLEDAEIEDEDIWRIEMYKYAEYALILMARGYSARYNNQSLRLWGMGVPVDCF